MSLLADDGGSDNDAGKPFVVRRHDVPRRRFRGGVSNHVLGGFHIIVPMLALLGVVG
jgi:hypothetical protein